MNNKIIYPKKHFNSFCDKSSNTICPFNKKRCFKLSKAEIGICALEHKNEMQIICPFLFPKQIIFDLIAKEVVKSSNYSVFSEVKLGNNFLDFLMVDNTNQDNYCGIEFQALDTSGNYRWLFGDKVKPFCINWKTTKKTILSQLLVKTNIFRNERRKIVLVVQKTFFDYISFKNSEKSSDGDLIILTFDYSNNVFTNYSFLSVSFDNLLASFFVEQVSLKDIVHKTIKCNSVIDNN